MDNFLKLLLEKEDTVILPGFGAIVIEDRASGKLFFNEFLKFNDGKLDNVIIENSKMDLQEAQNSVAKYVREIQMELDKGETYDIYEVGSLKKAADGRIEISSTKAVNKSSQKPTVEATQGPSPTPPAPEKKEEKPVKEEEIPIKEESIKEEKPKKVESKPKVDLEVNKKESKPNEKQEKTKKEKKNKADKPAKPKKEKKKKKKSVLFWIIILILALFAGGGIYVGTNYDEVKAYMGWDEFDDVDIAATTRSDEAKSIDEEASEIDQGDLNEPEVIEEESISLEEEINEPTPVETEPEVKEEVIEEEPELEKEPKTPVQTQPAPQPSASSSGNYHLIGGTFTDKNNAERLVEELKAKGHPAEIIGFLNNMHYVSVRSYSSAQEAQRNAASVQNDAPGAWVYKRP